MPILFFNTFTGIAINEITDLFKNSEAENISTKIEYVFKLNDILKKYYIIKKCIIFVESLLNICNTKCAWVLRNIKSLIHLRDKNPENNLSQSDAKDISKEKLNSLILTMKNVEDKCTKLDKIETIKKERKQMKQHLRNQKNYKQQSESTHVTEKKK